MANYMHPNRDTEFVLNEVLCFDRLCADLGLADVNGELASAVLDEASKLGSTVLAPLNAVGDRKGVCLTDAGVQEPPGFADAYRLFSESGWCSLTAPEAFGGQALPNVLGTAVSEVWHAANMAFALCPLLTQGAVEALVHHASPAIQGLYLPRLISGEWTGTMNLTEPDAGSDLAAVRARAVPEGDHYRISGQKIFISWGDHQMAPNVIHLVLARLPGAPAGVKGLSLFLVPKYLPDAAGEPGEGNDVRCVSLEHKLGIHGSPTCTMSFGDEGGAIGYLVGEPHSGLACMFTMMNHARQAVGLQGLAIAERAWQDARAYARERQQGTHRDGGRYPIIRFPDVRRMLMQMKASTEAMRALALIAAAESDRADHSPSEPSACVHQGRVEMYTPIIKGWLTELAQEVTSLAVQVHGGMGYVEETGVARHFRDARILPIYEGTNGIQAMDLIGRKILANGGALLAGLLEDIETTLGQLHEDSRCTVLSAPLGGALDDARQACQYLLNGATDDPALPGSVAFNMMMLLGYLCGGWAMARSALAASSALDAYRGDPVFLEAKLVTARFYAEQLLPRTRTLLVCVLAGSYSTMALDDTQF
ncbi:acyl-CoA dehydrogenase [Stutzerimonas stutzeri]|uniref:3-methylmercaptopropionyl-CoA dehydrogenase n=1 Tax=Stutzerimonas stutzeri TaxID=316 RepID=W8RCK5_STUST|nr:acyl-CoA dehydrogenase [Stutzerimonas stutzeri]AHL77478.1 acyl-CoA dehydrogenase [Stutzerimonas stutzeri]MCQ4330376.1 acyl-CoA dehydrogenase [Stutzerimonas stutzeri]